MPRTATSVILGRNTNLRDAVERAFRLGKVEPEKIERATRARYIGRILRALKARPDPEAPALYTNQDGDTLCSGSLAETKAVAEALWREGQARMRALPTMYGTLTLLKHMRAHMTPITGICLARSHHVFPDLIQPSLSIRDLHPVQVAPEHYDDVSHFLLSHNLCPTHLAAAGLRHAVVCAGHQQMTCGICKSHADALTMDLPTMLTWEDRGCVTCRNRDWLALKKPPKYSPNSVKGWLASTRQFAEAL